MESSVDPDEVMAPLQAASSTWRIAAGPRAGRKALTLAGRGELSESHRTRVLCANHQGFSRHAGVHCGADDRQSIEKLCCYITRPAIANARLRINPEGNVVLKLKTAWRDGATHIILTPMVNRCACGGKLTLIAVIEEADVIEKILMHIGLDPQSAPRAKVRRGELFQGD